jgi:quinoprotein glucose dehydrogenase
MRTGVATGALNIGGSIVTAGDVVFVAGTNDSMIRGFDDETGAVLWQAKLKTSGHATPMTFSSERTGRQYVVIASGGGGIFSKGMSDTLEAFALPKARTPSGSSH